MLYKTLGNTEIKVSEFALGCWPFAGGRVWGGQDDSMSIQTVHAALDRGINFFDTAEGYDDDSHSEEVLGRALLGKRSQSVIATKISPPHLIPDLIEKRAMKVCKDCERIISISTRFTGLTTLYQLKTLWQFYCDYGTWGKFALLVFVILEFKTYRTH